MNKIKFFMVSILTAGTLCGHAAPAKAPVADDEDIKIVKIDDNNFENEILKSTKPTILEISSTSCPPCLIMIPTLISIAKNYPDIKVASIGIDEPNIEKIKNTLPIQAFPTFFFIKDGQIINRLMGAVKEEDLLKALQYTPKPAAAKAKAKKKKNSPKNLTCSVNGQFSGLQNHVTISFVFGKEQIENVDIVTDVFIPPELESRRESIKQKFIASGKSEVTETMTGFRLHTGNESRFMKAMDMKRTSTYGEMKAGLELQGFTCK